MQINLTSQPKLLSGPDLAIRFQNAMTSASSFTRVKLFDGPDTDADMHAFQVCIDRIFQLTQKRGVARETAAAVMLSLAVDGCVMQPASGRWLRELAPVGYPLGRTSRNQKGKKTPRLCARFLDVQPIYALANVLGLTKRKFVTHWV